jgi:hypothetical protein
VELKNKALAVGNHVAVSEKRGIAGIARNVQFNWEKDA